jgi:hypothetical protein
VKYYIHGCGIETGARCFDFLSDISNSQNASKQEQWKLLPFLVVIWRDWNTVLKVLFFVNRCSFSAQTRSRLPIPSGIIHILIFLLWHQNVALCKMNTTAWFPFPVLFAVLLLKKSRLGWWGLRYVYMKNTVLRASLIIYELHFLIAVLG